MAEKVLENFSGHGRVYQHEEGCASAHAAVDDLVLQRPYRRVSDSRSGVVCCATARKSARFNSRPVRFERCLERPVEHGESENVLPQIYVVVAPFGALKLLKDLSHGPRIGFPADLAEQVARIQGRQGTVAVLL